MSEFLAEARILVRPDTSKFRAELQAQLTAATKGVTATIPVAIAASGAGIAAAASATAALRAAQESITATTLGLASAAQVESSAFGRQAVILATTTAATEGLAGAQVTLDAATKKTTASLLGAGSASARLDAGLLGLRTAVGSAAVIGLGALALAAIAAGKAINASVRNFAEFQAELAAFRVIAGATAEEMRTVSEQAARLGADVRLPAVSAADAAIAMTELAKAGLTVEEAMRGAEGVLQLATAAQISNAEAAQISANALNSFGLAGDQAVRVADDLANAANAAQGSITDFGLAFRQSAAVARQVGLSLEDTTALLALLAKNGLQGSDAGTSLRVALLRLVAPTDKAKAAIQDLGLKIRDAQGNVRPDVFAQFARATEDLTPAMRDAAAVTIFGADAIRTVAIAGREGADGLRLMQFQIDQQGTAAEVAAARTEGLAGSLSALRSNAETLSISLGKLISPVLGNLADGFASLAAVMTTSLNTFEEWNTALAQFIDSLPGGQQTNDFIDFFASPGKAFSETTRILNTLISGSDEAGEKIKTLGSELKALQQARVEAERGGQSGIADQLTKEINALRDEIKALKEEGQGISSGVTKPLQDALASLEKVRDIRISLGVDTGPIDKLIASLEKSIPITQKVEGNIQRLRDDFLNLGNNARSGASGVDVLTRALNNLRSESAQTQAELLKLQTEGGTPQEQIAVLQADIATQFEIIAKQRARGGASGAATAIKQAREQIKRNQAEIAALQSEIASEAKAAASEAEKQRDEQDAAIQRQFDAATAPIERLLDRAAFTEPLKDNIRFTTQLIELYRKQIEQATKRVKDAETRNRILKALGDRLFAAILSRKRLQQQERERIRAALEERLERIQTGIELDIDLADLNENTQRSIALRLKLIAQLKKEAKVLKLQGNALKENRNERARLQKEIDELRKQEERGGRKRAAEFFFEQLQAQQGFTANLLGNLITGPTEGLVGVPAPAPVIPDLGARIGAEAGAAAGRAAAVPTAGQANTEIDVLRRILFELQRLNGSYDAPEAINQKKQGSGSMDIAVM